MKVIYQNETKRFPELKSYSALIQQTAKAFSLTQQDMVGIKFYYIDSDGDVISLTNQDDLDEAMTAINGVLKVVASKNIDEAKMTLMEAVRSSESVLNQSMSSINFPQFNPN
jgi:hypothetical protein